MDVKEAVRRAKEHAALVFEGETVRVEEVWFDHELTQWCVTIGIQRPEPTTGVGSVLGGRAASSRMHYKTIRIAPDGNIASVKNHEKMPISPL